MRYWITGLLLAACCGATSLQAQPRQETFSSWQLTCNNLNACVVRTIPADGGLAITLTRAAGINDSPELSIDYGNRYSGRLNGGALRDNLLLDGRRFRPDLKHWQVEPHHLRTAHSISIDEFLAQILQADTLQLLYRADATLKLAGLKAALAAMDEVQGRSGNLSAWVKRGDGPPWRVPAEPRPPKVVVPEAKPAPLTPEETRTIIDYATWHINSEQCSLEPQRREISVAPLSDSQALLLVSCESGAYNVIERAYELDRRQPSVAKRVVLTLPFNPPDGQERQIELVNAVFDSERGELFTFSKNRGLGDCGVATRWQFDGQQFVLDEYAREDTCDAWHSSDRWPTLWVSQRDESLPEGEVEIAP